MDLGSDSAGRTVVPAELSVQPPRNVRMTGTGWANVVAIMVFLGLAVAWAFHVQSKSMPILRVRSALRTGASEAVGQITREWTSGRNSTQHISYSFQVGGNLYNGDSTVPDTIWEQLKNDSEVKIGYLPADPAINHPTGWEESTWSICAPLMIAVAPALGGLSFILMLLSQRRLLVEGLFAQGRITEIKKGNRGGFIMKYEFRTETGDLVASGCSGVETQEIGSTVRVLYLPNRPHRNQIYPIETFRVDQ